MKTDASDDGHDGAPRSRSWSVTLQVNLWTTVTVDAASLDEAVASAERETQLRYGDDVFIDVGSAEVA